MEWNVLCSILLCCIGFLHAAKQITIYQNNEELRKIECLESIYSKPNFETLRNLTVIHFAVHDACDHNRHIPQLVNFTEFIALVDMYHCPHMKKTNELEKRGAKAVLLVSTEDYVGMLIPFLDDFSNEMPNIPSAVITRKDGKYLTEFEVNSVTVEFASHSNRSLQNGWKVYVPLFFVFLITEGFGWILCLLNLHHKPNAAASNIVCYFGVFQCFWQAFDILFDHWNIRGFISLTATQIIYGIGIGPIFINVYVFCWLWYCITDEKRNIKRGTIDPQYRLLPFAILPQIGLEVMKFGLFASGDNARQAWWVYNIVNTAVLVIGGSVYVVVGYRLRNTIKLILTDKDNNRHRYVGWVTYVGVVNLFGAAASLYLWVFSPSFAGTWSFFILSTFWRIATLVQNGIQMMLFLPKSRKTWKELFGRFGLFPFSSESITLPSMNRVVSSEYSRSQESSAKL